MSADDGLRETIAERDQEIDRLRAAIDRDPLKKRHVGELLDLEDERDRLRAVAEAAQTLISELDSNPIGEYGDAVCEAIDDLDAQLKALDAKEGATHDKPPYPCACCHDLDKAEAELGGLRAERDRLRGIVEAARRWRAAAPGHESAVAIQVLYEALDAEEETSDADEVLAKVERDPAVSRGTGLDVTSVDGPRAIALLGEAYRAAVLFQAERDRQRDWRIRDGETTGAILDLVAPDLNGVNSGDELIELVRGVVAERDRLQAVVDVLREYRAVMATRVENVNGDGRADIVADAALSREAGRLRGALDDALNRLDSKEGT